MPEIALPVTTTLASVLSLWLLVLSWMVIASRRSTRTSLGDGGDKILQRRIRAQGNLAEYAPLFVILIGSIEIQGGDTLVLSGLAALFALGRLAHGYAFTFTENSPLGRVAGMILTLIATLAAALYGLSIVIL